MNKQFQGTNKQNKIYTAIETGYVLSNGILNKENGHNTGLINLIGYTKLLVSSSGLNNTACAIAFYDKEFNFLSDISVLGNTSISKTIDLNNDSYKDVYYLIVSSWPTTGQVTCINENYFDVETVVTENVLSNLSKISIESKAIDVNLSGYIKEIDGTYGSGGYHSEKISLEGYDKIKIHSLGLDERAAIAAFYDSQGDYIREISMSETGGTISMEIDITGEQFNSAKYISFSSWNATTCFVINSISNQSFLSGKKFCCLGDSISDGDGNGSYSWYDMLLIRYNANPNSLNFAVSGQCLRTMADNCTQENMSDVDFCFVMGGTNQLSNYRLGQISDEATPDRWSPNTSYAVGDKVLGGTLETHGNDIKAYLYCYECVVGGISGNTEDASGFSVITDEQFVEGTVTWKCIGNPSWYSDMKGICRKVYGLNPKIQIIWIVPIKTKHDIGINPDQWVRAQKFQAIRDFCISYSIRFIDLQKEFPINEYTKDAIMQDNLHPNSVGYRIIQDIICSHIE